MKLVGANTGILGNMASGKAAHDPAAAEAARAALIDAAARIEAAFLEQGGADPASEARPEIWTNWDDFLLKASAFAAAAAAVDVASAQSIGAGMGGMGASCKDCHTAFRVAN